jgi:putative salt-induced outer membrane protein
MSFSTLVPRAGLAALIALAATPASAGLPEPVRAMIEAAIATGDEAKVRAVVEAARATNPDEHEAIDAMFADFQEAKRERERELAQARREEILHAGLFDRWEGSGQIGAFQSSGNNDNAGVTAALELQRFGIDWRHKLRTTLDYQRTNDTTTREQYFVSYEPRFDINPGLFAFALAQWERDRFQGFYGRYAVSAGLGYQVLARDNIQLSLKAGPAYRFTEFANGRSEESLAALAGIDFDWQLSDTIKLTQDTDFVAEGGGSATAIIDAQTTTLNLVTGVEADLIDWLTARLSYAVEYDSNPPPGAVSTDTLTRFTLVYDF